MITEIFVTGADIHMIRIAVVDDEPRMLERLNRKITEDMGQEGVHFVTALFEDPRELLDELERGEKFQVFLLDIEMPGMDGMDLAARIREREKNAYLLFITSHVEYAVEGYELNAYRFIPKLLLEEKLLPALDGIREAFQEAERQRTYTIQNSLRCEKIPVSSILYLYKDGKNVVFVTEHGLTQERTTLGDVYERLGEEDFLFIDRGYLVNIRHVMKVKNNEVFLRDGTTLYISRSHVQEVKRKISAFWS